MADTEEKKPEKELTKEDKEFNRQINYFVMRYMWQVVCGRSARYADDTIYNAFSTSRERYTRIINTGIVRYKKEELETLYRKTGIPTEIFTGEKRFECPYNKETEAGKDISESDWKKLFASREKKDQEEEQQEAGKAEDRKKIQKAICEKLDKVPRNDIENWSFYCLCFYLKKRKPGLKKSEIVFTNGVINEIREMDFEFLNTISSGC